MRKISTTVLSAIFWVALLTGFSACGGSGGYQGESALQKEVFKIHNEVMPLSQNIYLLRKDLLDVKSNGTFDKKMLSTNEKMEIDSVCIELTRAEEGMNTWMRSFKDPEYGTSMSVADAYFKAELPKMKKVADDVTSSVAKAKALAARFPIRAAETTAPKTSTKTTRDTTKKATTTAPAPAETPTKNTENTPQAPENNSANEKTPSAEKPSVPKAGEPTIPKAATTPKVSPAGSKISR